MSGTSTEQSTERFLQCLAGHTWKAEGQHAASGWCPTHAKFRVHPIAARYMPPKLEVERWQSTGRYIKERGYVTRWTKRWEMTVRMVAARQNSFSALPIDDIAEYIRHERHAELHRHFAEQAPYTETSTGTAKAHPGWERARIEEVAARSSARKLGLLPPLAGEKESARDGYKTKMQLSAEETGGTTDDQAGL